MIVHCLVTQPPVPFEFFLLPVYCLAFVCSGWGYFVSCLVPPQNATLTTSVLMLVLNGAIGDPGKMGDYIDGGFMEFVVALCPTRWSVQMFYLQFYVVGRELPAEPALINIYKSQSFDAGQSALDGHNATHMKFPKPDDVGDAYLVLVSSWQPLCVSFLRSLNHVISLTLVGVGVVVCDEIFMGSSAQIYGTEISEFSRTSSFEKNKVEGGCGKQGYRPSFQDIGAFSDVCGNRGC